MEKKLTIAHLAPYLPYGLKFKIDSEGYFSDHELTDRNIDLVLEHIRVFNHIKPILRPLSRLTQEIEHNGERFEPAHWFEICDDENDSLEFDFGNVRLIKRLKDIAKYNNHHDINYLPFYVVQKLIEWNFDIYGLLDTGLAIEKGDAQ